MSVVGPRPIVEEELAAYGDAAGELLSVKPGITGWWQVQARNDATYGDGSRQELELWDFADEREGDDGMAGLKEPTSNVYGNGHALLYADVADAIENDRAPYVDARAGRDALEVVLAIYKSQRTGLPVELPLEDFASTDMEGEF